MKQLLASLLALALAAPAQLQGPATFKSTTNLVVVNVTVTGRDGKPIQNLSKADFLLYEDGKPQTLESVDFQRLNGQALPPLAPGRELQSRTPANPAQTPPPPSNLSNYQDRRLIAMLFDFSSMAPGEQIRARDAALKFLATQMTASDMVSILVFGSELKTVQDFTADRDLLASTIQRFRIGESSELAGMAGTGADAEDQSGMFVADDTEFNIFNTDRKLAALEDAARTLARYPEKKALVYFSSGVEKTGVDNQSQLEATVNVAVRANVAFYPIDARGLLATPPGGDATTGSSFGSGLYSGASQKGLRDSFHNQQETLFTLASDTGGKALLDSNDLTEGIRRVQQDIGSYYILTYRSSNAAEDGRYRKIQVKLAPNQGSLSAKLNYRQGYYAPVSFARMHESDRESQLQEAMESANPVVDLPLAVEVDYFRLAKGKYFVPVTVRIPGSALLFKGNGAKRTTGLDFIGEVRDSHNRAASAVRDSIPLKVDQATAGEVARRQIVYDTGFTLAPGQYTLRFVARENGLGKTGTFETPFRVPDLDAEKTLRLSSLVVANQVQPANEKLGGAKNNNKLTARNPLIDAGSRIVPNVTRVFHPGQSIYAWVEVYDPKVPENLPANMHVAAIASDLTIYSSTGKVLETPPLRINRPDARRPDSVPIHLQASLKDLKPGRYTCQVNVIDELGRKFAFARDAIVIVP